MLFDSFLGTWVGRRIVCIGDYANKLPPSYDGPLDRLYDDSYGETLSLTDIAKGLLANFKAHCPAKAKRFQEEYSMFFKECFPPSQRHILLNLITKKYVVNRQQL